MNWCHLVITVIVLSTTAAEDKAPKTKESGKDILKTAETRIPVLPYGGGFDPYASSGLAYGVEPYGAGLHGLGPAVLPIGAGVGYPTHGALLQKPYGLADGIGYNSGYLKHGLNDGAFALGNHGSDGYRAGHDGRFADGSFHNGGAVHDSGYQGLEGYKDNKHHIADDYANKGYFSGAQGVRKDIGNGEAFNKNHNFAQNGYSSLGDQELAKHNKGHHRTGFKKSYHKDESGNDESFYDSDHDEGNHALGKKYGDEYGTNVGSHVNGGHNLNEYDARQHGNEGYEGNGKLLALNEGIRDYYGKNGYYNSGNKYGSLGGGQSSNFGKYGQQNGYLNGYNNGRSLDNFQGSKFGGGYGSPYLY